MTKIQPHSTTPLFFTTQQPKKIIVQNVLTKEQYDAMCRTSEQESEKVLLKWSKLHQQEQIKTAKENKKIQKMIQDVIEELRIKGEPIPTRLANILKSLKTKI